MATSLRHITVLALAAALAACPASAKIIAGDTSGSNPSGVIGHAAGLPREPVARPVAHMGPRPVYYQQPVYNGYGAYGAYGAQPYYAPVYGVGGAYSGYGMSTPVFVAPGYGGYASPAVVSVGAPPRSIGGGSAAVRVIGPRSNAEVTVARLRSPVLATQGAYSGGVRQDPMIVRTQQMATQARQRFAAH